MPCFFVIKSGGKNGGAVVFAGENGKYSKNSGGKSGGAVVFAVENGKNSKNSGEKSGGAVQFAALKLNTQTEAKTLSASSLYALINSP